MASSDGTGARQVSHDGVDAENATATPDGRWVVFNSTNPGKSGIRKVHPDGTGATQIVKGTTAWPEVSPDGVYVSYAQILRAGTTELRVARIEDGQPLPFVVQLAVTELSNGRTRWCPDGRTIAFNWQAPGAPGIYAEDFLPGSKTRGVRRPLVQLEPEAVAESFGLSPDGKHLTLSASYRIFNLMSAENIAGLEPGYRTR